MIAILGILLFAAVIAFFYWLVRNNPALKFVLIVFTVCFTLVAIKILWETDKHSQYFDSFWSCELETKDIESISITSSKCICNVSYTDSNQIANILSTLCSASQIPFEIAHGGTFRFYNLKIKKRDHSYIYLTLTTEKGNRYTTIKLHTPKSDAWAEKQSMDIVFALKDVIECEESKCSDKF